ncbi:MAG TPA: rhomboid-like protein [Trebonia sp.]
MASAEQPGDAAVTPAAIPAVTPADTARRYAVAWTYLGCFAAMQVVYALLAPRAQDAFMAWASTSVTNLEHDPVGCLVVSAFVTGGGIVDAVVWLPMIALAMFGANRAIGAGRTICVCVAGHVIGTLVSEGIVAWRVGNGTLPPGYRHLTDVGPSYVVVSAVVAALLCGPRLWRLLAALDLAVLVLVVRIFAGLHHLDVAAVGHATAIVTAAIAVPLLARRSRGQPPVARPPTARPIR